MLFRFVWVAAAFLVPTLVPALATTFAAAQSAQPYAGMETRQVKALSEQQIADLRAGRGMGLALAAELNGYPGPIHVLELADKLQLDTAQRARVQTLFDTMKAEAVPLGERLIVQEAALDSAFSSRAITGASLSRSLSEIGATQAALRNTHLKYHLQTRAALQPHQIALYQKLRGYAGEHGGASHGDTSHGDTSHGDTSHGGTGHGNGGHGAHRHGN